MVKFKFILLPVLFLKFKVNYPKFRRLTDAITEKH